MRKLITLLGVGLLLIGNTGCFLNMYSSDPAKRGKQLIYQSENLRQIENTWSRIWFTNQPSHLTYERVHGGIQP